MIPQPSRRAADDTRGAIAPVRLWRAIADLRWDLLVLKTTLRLHRRYGPNQPRVPAGSAEGGQWTSGGATSPREMTARRGTPLAEATPRQLAAIAVATKIPSAGIYARTALGDCIRNACRAAGCRGATSAVGDRGVRNEAKRLDEPRQLDPLH